MNLPRFLDSHRLRAVLLLLIVFVIGAATGIGGSLLAMRHLAQRGLAGNLGPYDPLVRVSARWERDIAAELDFSPSEAARAHHELTLTVERLQAMRSDMYADGRVVIADTIERVAADLPEEKRAAFRESIAKRLRPWSLAP